MSEAYQHKEHELRSAIDNINCISYIFEDYVKETNYFIDRLLEDTKEINTLKKENERLNKSLEKQRHFYLDQLQQKENVIKEVREYANNIMFETKAEEKIQDDILEILNKGDD